MNRDIFQSLRNDGSVNTAARRSALRRAWAALQTHGRFDIIDRPIPADKSGSILAVIVNVASGPVRVAMTRNEVDNLIRVLEASR